MRALRIPIVFIATIFFATSSSAASSSPLNRINLPAAQMFPAVNMKGNIAFRSAHGSHGAPHAILWQQTYASPPVFLDGGFAPTGSADYFHRDALSYSMGTYNAAHFNHLNDSLGMFGRIAHTTLSPSIPSSTIPLPLGSPGRIGQVAMWITGVSHEPFIWSEYRSGKWRIAIPDGTDFFFLDTDGDSLEPSIGGGKESIPYIAWTSVHQERAILAGKYSVFVVDPKKPSDRLIIPEARHPSFATHRRNDSATLLIEKYDGNGISSLEAWSFPTGIVNPVKDVLKVGCKNPRRPVATEVKSGKELAVLFVCPQNDPRGTQIHLLIPGKCEVKLDTIGFAPKDHEQVQYDIAENHFVYSKFFGPNPDDFDIVHGNVSTHCP